MENEYLKEALVIPFSHKPFEVSIYKCAWKPPLPQHGLTGVGVEPCDICRYDCTYPPSPLQKWTTFLKLAPYGFLFRRIVKAVFDLKISTFHHVEPYALAVGT